MLGIFILCGCRCIIHRRVEKAAFAAKREIERLFFRGGKSALSYHDSILDCKIILIMHILQ